MRSSRESRTAGLLILVLCMSGCLTSTMWTAAMMSPLEVHGVAVDKPEPGRDSLVFRIKGLMGMRDGYYYVSLLDPTPAPSAGGATFEVQFHSSFESDQIPTVHLPLARLSAEDVALPPRDKVRYGLLTPDTWSPREFNEVQIHASRGEPARWTLIGHLKLPATREAWSSRSAIRTKYVALSFGTLLFDVAMASIALAVVLVLGVGSGLE